MTNQEMNQRYWGMPIHWRNALDALLQPPRRGSALSERAAIASAADLIRDGLAYAGEVVSDQEARSWAEWRMAIARSRR